MQVLDKTYFDMSLQINQPQHVDKDVDRTLHGSVAWERFAHSWLLLP